MKKLLLLSNCISLCALLSSCQTTPTKNNMSISDTMQTVVSADSISKSKVVLQSDTSNANRNTSLHSAKQTTSTNSANSSIQTATKTTVAKRIEHGSDNQAKLDSIKKAKTKLKK